MHKSKLVGLVVGLLAAIATAVALAPAASATGPTYGGDSIRNDSYFCTAGIPVRSGSGQSYILTAGHCGGNRPTGTWEDVPFGPLPIGATVRWAFGNLGPDGATQGQDIAAIRSSKNLFPTPQARSQVAIYNITGLRDPRQGEHLCFPLGESRRTICGTVTTLETNQLASDPHLGTQRIYRLAAVTLDAGDTCATDGDSGSPGLAGTVATGVLSGCNPSRRLIFMSKVGAIATAWGLSL